MGYLIAKTIFVVTLETMKKNLCHNLLLSEYTVKTLRLHLPYQLHSAKTVIVSDSEESLNIIPLNNVFKFIKSLGSKL